MSSNSYSASGVRGSGGDGGRKGGGDAGGNGGGNGKFGAKTTAMDVLSRFEKEVRGSVVLITGISPNSIGEAAVLVLAQKIGKEGVLILVSRTRGKMVKVVERVWEMERVRKGEGKERVCDMPRIECVVVDLADFESVRKGAKEVVRVLGGRELTHLFNNAGIHTSHRLLTPQNHESQLQTNHLGPFLLTLLLLPHLAPSCRIINTSSSAHRISPFCFSDYDFKGNVDIQEEDKPRRGLPDNLLRGTGDTGYQGWVAYASSKTANLLFGVGLRVRGYGAWGVHPGTIMTSLPRYMDELAKKDLENVEEPWKTPEQGAATMLVAAFDPTLDGEF